MILAHLSDIHLGHRIFPREERGLNLRERDVARVFHAAIEALVRLRPDLIVLAGDIFDTPHPPAGALTQLSRGLEFLHGALPDAPILLVAGARDTPLRPADPGVLTAFDALPGVEAASGAPRSIHLQAQGAHALLLPHRAIMQSPFPAIRPDPTQRWNVLVARGAVACGTGRGPVVETSDWDYIAAGCGHEYRRFGSNAHQAGSLERIGPAPWLEAGAEKGFITCDLSAGTHRFHPVPGRPVVRLPPLTVDAGAPEKIGSRLREVVEAVPGGIRGKLVHLAIDGLPPERIGELEPSLLAHVRGEVAHLRLTFENGPHLFPLGLCGPGVGIRWDSLRVRRLSRGDVSRRAGSSPEVGDGLVSFIVRDAPVRSELLGGLHEALIGEPPDQAVYGQSPFQIHVGGDRGSVPGLTRCCWIDVGISPIHAVREGVRELTAFLAGRDEHVPWSEDAPLDGRDPVHDPEDGAEGGPNVQGPSRGESDDDPERLARELQAARADAAEEAGELDVRIMEWLRERQDAETHLLTYRDRARVLQARLQQVREQGPDLPCPMCGVVLEDRFEEVLKGLEEEWEEVVQDGTWWRRRREQLELKPDDLRERERSSLELQAKIRVLTERLERARVRSGSPGADLPATGRGAAVEVAIVRRGSAILSALTGGSLGGIQLEDGRLELVRDGRAWLPRDEEDCRPTVLALRLATLELAGEAGVGPGVVVLTGALEGLSEEGKMQTLHLLRTRFGGIPQRLVVTKGELAERFPEYFDSVLEVLPDPGPGRPSVRRLASGPASLVLREG